MSAELNPHHEKANPETNPISKWYTIVIAPSPAIPLDMDMTYRPAVRPAAKKSLTLFMSPFVKETE